MNQFNNNSNNNGGAPGSQRISTIFIYKMFLAREKSLYTTLNMLVLQNQTFIGYFWAPAEEEFRIIEKLNNVPSVRVAAYNKHQIPRPTFIKTNKVTGVYQQIVDTYGVPTYQEANPALLSIVTFPFFFGMMFGDMGHGSVLFVIAAYLVLFAKRIKNPLLKGALEARYLLLLMGLMSCWAGLIYNEYFAIPTNIFGSCYNMNNPQPQGKAPEGKGEGHPALPHPWIIKRNNSTCVYPFGQDAVWAISNNKLTLVNSIKMKMSVIFGVLHMTFGIFCKGTNLIYRG